MKQKSLLIFTYLFLMLLPLVQKQGVAKPKPNIVHILADDFGWQDPVCFDIDGKTPFETPNLDKLAARGRKFMQAYSAAPTCSPSRAAYITGKYTAHTGVYHVVGGRIPRPRHNNEKKKSLHIDPYYPYRLPTSDLTIPKELKKAGYSTAHVGKWHVGGRSNGYPFPGEYGFDISYVNDVKGGGVYYPDPDIWGGGKDDFKNWHNGLARKMKPDRLSDFATSDPDDPCRLDEDGRPYDKTLDVALRWLKKHHAEPFFLNYCTYYVHGPIQARNKERFEYYCKKMGYEVPTDPGVMNEDSTTKSNPYYATMVETLDWMIGKVMTYLEETDDPRNPGHKLIDNTYIVISSDNGGVLDHPQGWVTDNSPLKYGKHFLEEGGVRVPFIVSGPNIPKGTSCETPITLVDLYPTFTSMVGLAAPQNKALDGCNILPIMEGKEKVASFPNGKVRESIYFYHPIGAHAAGAIRKGPYKLYKNVAIGSNEEPEIVLYKLYNEDGSFADIGEEVNIAEQKPEVVKEILADLDNFMDEANVTLPYKHANAEPAHPFQENVPKVLDRGEDGDKLWVEVEYGKGKTPIKDAKLIYILNGSLFERSNGRKEMWFALPANINKGRIEATMPPGASHAVFCLTDKNGFLILSEDVPTQTEHSISTPETSFLKDGYAFKPGLYALIKVAEDAKEALSKKNKQSDKLASSLKTAREVYQLPKKEVSIEKYCETIRALRNEVRNLKGQVPQAENFYLNQFRQGGAF